MMRNPESVRSISRIDSDTSSFLDSSALLISSLYAEMESKSGGRSASAAGAKKNVEAVSAI